MSEKHFTWLRDFYGAVPWHLSKIDSILCQIWINCEEKNVLKDSREMRQLT